MSRCLIAALLGATLIGTTTWAEDPPPNVKARVNANVKAQAPKRIAINDPAKLADDMDFKIQGEYVGEIESGKVGLNLVADGNNKFRIKAFLGGLPGDGWDGEETKSGTAEYKDGKLQIKTDDGLDLTASWKDGVLTAEEDGKNLTFKKVERKSSTLGAKAPEGAVVLFAGPGDESNWAGGKLLELSDGKFLNYGIKSKQSFGAFKAHVEFRLPWMPNSRGQQRANSGVYLQDRYEIQVLDSFGLSGENNECAGIYQQYKPLVNMCYPPMVWQTYDIEFTPAKFDDTGKRIAPARLTLLHNGVKVHDNIEFKGSTGGGQAEKPTPGPLQFQNHGDPLAYRNVWVQEIK